ncbi:hypothetical protein DP939_02655 [Spongiactinospora rosea]|uniref:Uncharacterized protein n=1 Tax=Spongiactinospora rosea TaxID=2248750 RepID=A0A366M7B9_9ACTN|nr:hypothetical protein [Spongiactinospora rosea]RBQ21630.1 hypothetical protein DP939_02655 [Spongiactinospora rosea]
MTDHTVAVAQVLDVVRGQRNAALDEVAKLTAAVDDLLAENNKLRAENERLTRGDTAPTVVSGTVES